MNGLHGMLLCQALLPVSFFAVEDLAEAVFRLDVSISTRIQVTWVFILAFGLVGCQNGFTLCYHPFGSDKDIRLSKC